MHRIITLFAFAFSFCSVPSVSAAELIVTYSGQISSGYDGVNPVSQDTVGIFGSADTLLDGLAFTAIFRISEPPAGAVADNGIKSDALGGSHYGRSPFISATILINNVLVSFDGTLVSATGKESTSDYQTIFHAAQSRIIHDLPSGTLAIDRFLVLNVFSIDRDLFQTTDLNEEFVKNLAGSSIGSGSIYDVRFDPVKEQYVSAAIASLNVTSIDVRTAVPEPSTWLYLILGFGFVGIGLRRGQMKNSMGCC